MPAIPPQPVRRRVLGLDLGKSVDYTALTLLEWTDRRGVNKQTYDVPLLKRWQIGTKYLDIAAEMVKFLQSPEVVNFQGPPPVLVVDETGVGAPIYETLIAEIVKQRVQCCTVGVTITAGAACTLHSTGRWRVAKKMLASVLRVLFEGKRLNIARMPETEILIREAQNFKVKITEALNETFESWRESDHDDLVLSLALACWAAEFLTWADWPPTGAGQPQLLRA